MKKISLLMKIRQSITNLTKSTPHFINQNVIKDNNFFKFSYSIIKHSLLALIICAIGDLCAGLILGNMTSYLLGLARFINFSSRSYWYER